MPTSRTDDTIANYHWLLSDDGASILDAIRDRMETGEPVLRISERLRRERPADRVALAITQVELRRQAATKFRDPDRLFFTREGLEQATSGRIAAHRAQRYGGYDHLIDLCSGIGGDLMALASLPGKRALSAVDLDPVHLMLATHNAGIVAPEQPVAGILDDVRAVPIGRRDAVFIDPARRDARGRMGGIESEPPLEWSIALADRAAAVGVKTAPGIPHEMVPDGWEMETIALGADLKEAVLWSPSLSVVARSATVIATDGTHRLEEVPGERVPVRLPEEGSWLLDPNPAVTRAGLVEDLARLVRAEKIDEEIGFLVSDVPVELPFARALPIIGSMPWHEKRLKARLRELDAGPIDVRRRGLAGDVGAITKRLRGRGARRVTVAMTRYRGEPWAIICDGA